MAEERQETGKKKENEKGEVSRNLPRNYRQIGEPGAKKIYVEDYVYTYLNKLAAARKSLCKRCYFIWENV